MRPGYRVGRQRERSSSHRDIKHASRCNIVVSFLLYTYVNPSSLVFVVPSCQYMSGQCSP